MVLLYGVRERRPRILEATHEHEHRRRELQRDRVLARRRGAVVAVQIEAVGDLERVDARIGGHRGDAEAQHRHEVRPPHAKREAAAEDPPQSEHDDRGSAEVAEQQAARSLVGEDHEHDREHHGHCDVRPGGHQVDAGALIDAQLRVGHLEVGERP